MVILTVLQSSKKGKHWSLEAIAYEDSHELYKLKRKLEKKGKLTKVETWCV